MASTPYSNSKVGRFVESAAVLEVAGPLPRRLRQWFNMDALVSFLQRSGALSKAWRGDIAAASAWALADVDGRAAPGSIERGGPALCE